MTDSDKLHIVTLLDFEVLADRDTPMGKYWDAETDCKYLNLDVKQSGGRNFIGATREEALARAIKNAQRSLRAPGYVQAGYRFVEFFLEDDYIPIPCFRDSEMVTIGVRE